MIDVIRRNIPTAALGPAGIPFWFHKTLDRSVTAILKFTRKLKNSYQLNLKRLFLRLTGFYLGYELTNEVFLRLTG
jgi:hypothetical protein